MGILNETDWCCTDCSGKFNLDIGWWFNGSFWEHRCHDLKTDTVPKLREMFEYIEEGLDEYWKEVPENKDLLNKFKELLGD